MAASLFSSAWHRVADLRPRLRPHVAIHRHQYRGRSWYVIQDDATGKHHRFTPEAYALIGLMDGRRTLEDIWLSAGERSGDDMPGQEDVIRLVAQLHQADVLQADVTPDTDELVERHRRQHRNPLVQALKSPLAVKLPLIDPEPFLNRTAWLGRWLFSLGTGVIWLLLVGWALVQAVVHWPALTHNLADRVLAAENLLVIGVVYPLVKLVHELGHAYAIKRWGGEVHEMGLMFLIFMPVPYVDASASASFVNKYQRMLVSGAGILVEAFIAALAMWVWVHAEPGAVRSVAFNVLLVAGVSTLLFNGNPLLRFDAYYVLADFLEIPNLGARGNRQVAYLWKRFGYGMDDEVSPANAPGEPAWLAGYAVASFIYRIFVTFAIILFVAGKLFVIGAVLAMLALYTLVGKPLVGMGKFLMNDRRVREKWPRVGTVTLVALTLVAVLLFAVPMPRMTVVHGVIDAPDSSRVLAASSGFIRKVVAAPGSEVKAGDVLIEADSPELDVQAERATAYLKELFARYQAAAAADRQSEVAVLAEEITRARAELSRVLEEQQGLTVVTTHAGRFDLAFPADPVGRFIPRGTLLGHVLQPGQYRVRAVVSQDQVRAIRDDLQGVEVRLAERVGEPLVAHLVGEVPGAQKTLPSPALSVEGGGQFALDPTSPDVPQAFDPVFQFDLQLDRAGAFRIGERVYVRFAHSPEPIAFRLYRSLRRTLLRELSL